MHADDFRVLGQEIPDPETGILWERDEDAHLAVAVTPAAPYGIKDRIYAERTRLFIPDKCLYVLKGSL